MDIAGKLAVVTGGASGLGGGTAEALAAAGAKVAVVDVAKEAAESKAQALGGVAIGLDVADQNAAEAAIEDLCQAHGNPAVLVNCAGIAPASRIVGREGPMSLDTFARVVNVNLVGTFNMLRLVAAKMAQNVPNEDGERGVIVNTSSVAAYEGQIGQAAYSASKGGIVALTMPAAREFAGIGVRVLAIAPGLFGTPLLLNMPQNVQDSLAATVPFPKRFGAPAEFAALVLHIVQNPMLNGEVIRLDGALRMAPR